MEVPLETRSGNSQVLVDFWKDSWRKSSCWSRGEKVVENHDPNKNSFPWCKPIDLERRLKDASF